MLRRLLIAAVLVAGFAAVASPRVLAANAITCPDPQPQTLTSTHFSLTYDDDPSASNYVSQSQAQTVLAGAEQAFSTFVTLGFTAPSGGSLPIELDVLNLTANNISADYCPQFLSSPAAIGFDSATIGTDNANETLYESVFAQFAFSAGIDIPWINGVNGAPNDAWALQGLSEWAALKALGYPSNATADLGPWDISLDCVPTYNPNTGTENATCSKTGFENDRLSHWPFFEYLSEKFGMSFITELMNDINTSYGIPGLQTALTAHGTSLGTEWSSFAGKLLSGGWTATGLNVVSPPVSGTIQTGATTGDTAPQQFRVGHLATRFVQIDRGDGSATHKCYAANLTINVTLPAGVTSQPVFYWAAANSSPVALSVSGTSATATVPWDTCKWSSHGYLSLANGTTNVDDAYFTVSTHLAVTTTETTAAPPSTPANSYGNSTDTTAAIGALKITLRGPSTLKLTSTDTTLDLVVEATDQGTVSAKLGALNLGTKTVVPGMNALHFTIPAGSTGTLTLTPSSGTAVTMTVGRDTPSSLAKLKAKAKKKPTLKFASKTKKTKPKK